MLKSLLLFYCHQQALSRSLTHSPPLGLSRGEPVSLGIHSAFSDFSNQRQREPDLCVVLRGPDLGTSPSSVPVSSCSTDGAEPNPPAQDSGLGRLGSQSSLHSLNCHQGFSIGGWPSVVTCPLTAGLRPLESSAKLP